MRIHRAVLALLLPVALQAQKAPACKWSAKDAWVKRQAEFFDDSKHDWSNDSLRTALLAAAGLSPSTAAPVQNGVRVEGRDAPLGSSSPAAVDQLRKLAATRGTVWPTRSVVGALGVHAVYLLTRTDTGLARAALHRMMEAGPSESPAADVATFEDELRIVWGRKQIYGTQFRLVDGKVALSPMEDSAHADLRREDAGLPPFRLGLCLAAAPGGH